MYLSLWFYVLLRARCHWSTVFYLRKGSKTPEATSDLARLDKNRPKRSTSPGASIVQGGWGLTHTHKHIPRAMCEKGGVEFLISISSIKFLGECWVWTKATNTRRGWVHGNHSPIEYANHYTMNGYKKKELDFKPIHAIVPFPFIFYLDSFSYLDYLYYMWRYYYTKFMKNHG